MSLKLMYITNIPEVAVIAEKYGVDRIWVDLERLGKAERQRGMDSVKSYHSVKDIWAIAPLLKRSELLVRVNAWNEGSVKEINEVIDAGADIIMLPMWKTEEEVKRFLSAVNGRAKTSLLLETREAEEVIQDVLGLSGIDEIHIGLNDLHIAYGLTFMFELLSNGTIERICHKIDPSGIPYGFGGVARIGEGTILAEEIILEHYRLHSTRAILSRSFCNCGEMADIEAIENIFSKNIKKLRVFEQYASTASPTVFEKNRNILKSDIDSVVKKMRSV